MQVGIDYRLKYCVFVNFDGLTTWPFKERIGIVFEIHMSYFSPGFQLLNFCWVLFMQVSHDHLAWMSFAFLDALAGDQVIDIHPPTQIALKNILAEYIQQFNGPSSDVPSQSFEKKGSSNLVLNYFVNICKSWVLCFFHFFSTKPNCPICFFPPVFINFTRWFFNGLVLASSEPAAMYLPLGDTSQHRLRLLSHFWWHGKDMLKRWSNWSYLTIRYRKKITSTHLYLRFNPTFYVALIMLEVSVGVQKGPEMTRKSATKSQPDQHVRWTFDATCQGSNHRGEAMRHV